MNLFNGIKIMVNKFLLKLSEWCKVYGYTKVFTNVIKWQNMLNVVGKGGITESFNITRNKIFWRK